MSPPPYQISPPHRLNDKGVGPQNLNFYSDLTKMWNINAPQGRIPFAIFIKFAEFVPHFRMRWVLKFGWICSRGYGVMGVLSRGGRVSPKFPAPVSSETMCQTPKSFRRAMTKFGEARISPAAGVAKNVEFFLSVCLFVRHAFERQRLCARFRHEGVGVQKRF